MSDEVDDVMAGEKFIRSVGRRQRPPRSTASALGQPPNSAARAALSEMAQYRTRVPKGVLIYASHEAANRDWERWQLEAMRVNSLVPREQPAPDGLLGDTLLAGTLLAGTLLAGTLLAGTLLGDD